MVLDQNNSIIFAHLPGNQMAKDVEGEEDDSAEDDVSALGQEYVSDLRKLRRLQGWNIKYYRKFKYVPGL